MKDVFRSDLVATKPVIIVDDLITTGASLRESIRALRRIENQVRACVVVAAN
jgi:orotate phosphoribosyltransferase